MVNPDWEAEDRPCTVITNCYHRLDKYSYYANTFPILVSDLHPIGSGTIHTEQISHTTEKVKPIDYIGLYIIVIAASMASVNWLFRIYF